MKLGMMLEVDETFATIWLSRSSEVRVKVRRWPQSHFGTILIRLSHSPGQARCSSCCCYHSSCSHASDLGQFLCLTV